MINFFYFFIIFSIAFSKSLNADQSSDQKMLIEDHIEFAFSLYPTLENSEDNVVFSPYSIANCLSMVYLGARGETLTQMQSALHLTVDRKNLVKVATALNQSLLPQQNNYKLNVANALWVDKKAFLLADFRYAIEGQLKSKLGMMNFAMPLEALTAINDWTSQETQGKILNILSPNDIDENTRLVLTNAVYFQGIWNSPFDVKQTHEAPFYPTPETNTKVKMMKQTLSTLYYENESTQAIALPFSGSSNSGSNLAFLILFPKHDVAFSKMFQELSTSYDEWLSSLKFERIDLSIPKFSFSNRCDLTKSLQDLGMEDAFNSNANFTGIDGMHDLFLNKIITSTFFAMNENGITASSATSATVNAASAAPQKPTVQLVIDHPFLFFIIDLKSHEMLFMGKVSKLGEI